MIQEPSIRSGNNTVNTTAPRNIPLAKRILEKNRNNLLKVHDLIFLLKGLNRP